MVEEFELPQLTKLQTNIPKVEDIKWCGNLEQYDDQYDRISTRTEKRLQVRETPCYLCFVVVSAGFDCWCAGPPHDYPCHSKEGAVYQAQQEPCCMQHERWAFCAQLGPQAQGLPEGRGKPPFA